MNSSEQGKPRLTGDVARERIVSAAARIISTHGIGGLRIRQVADEAGMHHASMLHHYASREDIIVAVAESVIAKFRGATQTLIGQKGGAEEAVVAHVNDILKEMNGDPAKFTLLTEIFAASRRDESLRKLLIPFENEWIDAIVSMLQLGQKRRSPLLAKRSAEAIVALVRGLGLCCNLDHRSVRDATRVLVRAFLDECHTG